MITPCWLAGSIELSCRCSGDPVPVASQTFWGNNDARVGVSASETGVIAITPMFRADQEFSLWTRVGRALESSAPPDSCYAPNFSHDGRKIAIARREPDGQAQNIWMVNPEGGSSVRFTNSPGWHGFPVWSPDNSEIIYASVEGDVVQRALYRQDVDGVRKPTRILAPQPVTSPYDWSRDGRLLVYGVMAGGGSHYDLWMLPLGDSRPPYPFLQSDHSARFAQFSPDSRFVAFSWAQSGRDEIFVRNVDGEKRRSWQISTSGGTQPRWSRDGKQIYFLSGSGKVVSAKVRVRGEEIEIAGSDALFPILRLRRLHRLINMTFRPMGSVRVPSCRYTIEWDSGAHHPQLGGPAQTLDRIVRPAVLLLP